MEWRGGVVAGITVGNAQARAAVYEDDTARLVPLEEGERSMASAVLLHRMREVGKYAYLYSGTDPNLLVMSINRLLGRNYSVLEQELRSQYLVAYSPSNKSSDGSYRKVELELVNPELRKQKLQLNYREGYFSRSGTRSSTGTP